MLSTVWRPALKVSLDISHFPAALASDCAGWLGVVSRPAFGVSCGTTPGCGFNTSANSERVSSLTSFVANCSGVPFTGSYLTLMRAQPPVPSELFHQTVG